MSENSPTSVDDLFGQLLSMGFLPEDCQDAITSGLINVETAVEWILNGKPVAQAGPKLQLRRVTGSMFDSGGIGPHNSPPTQNIPQTRNSIPDESKKVSEDEVQITSQIRNAEQQGRWDKFHEKERIAIQNSAKFERQEKQKNKEAILQKIAADREERRRHEKTENAVSTETVKESGMDCAVQNESVAVPGKSESKVTLIQIRLPCGDVVKHDYKYDDQMQMVWSVVQEKIPDTTGLVILQPFPRRVYAAEDFIKTFAELKLVPSGSLVISSQAPKVVSGNERPADSPAVQPEVRPENAPALVEIGGHSRPAELINHPNEAGNAARRRFEAHRHLVNNPNPGDLPLQPDEDLLANMHRVLNEAVGFEHMWGAGNLLQNAEIANAEPQPQVPNRLAANAALHRADNRLAPPESGSPQSSHSFGGCPPQPRLIDLCIQHVVRKLIEPSTRTPCLNLPAAVAERILAYMMKERLLSPKIIQPFLSCHLNNLVLDFYPYATNELLHALRFHVTIQHVSLASCSLITDAGLLKLTSFSQLVSLNVRECDKITDGVFAVLVEFCHLKSLNLDGTKVSDNGVCSYVRSGPTALRHLNLSRTCITNKSLDALSELVHLNSLSVDNTQITQLASLRSLVNLESLSVRANAILPQALLCLNELPRLNSLNIAELTVIAGDLALELIKDLKLKSLQLPARLTTTDNGLLHISNMQITVLNLANYIHLTDRGISSLRNMISLTTLILSNTKLTDVGLLSLQKLSNMDILYLDRTLITDEGMLAFVGMPLLTELSLASTSISKKCLMNGTLNCCLLLTKLNLSYTRVSDKGLRCLRLPNLSLISVDGTRLRNADPTPILADGCPRLRHVSAKNVQPRGIYDSHDED